MNLLQLLVLPSFPVQSVLWSGGLSDFAQQGSASVNLMVPALHELCAKGFMSTVPNQRGAARTRTALTNPEARS
eukprot:10647933-Alexandrium_andersonii.AAC.1